MTYRGHIKNGQVVLDEPAELAEGAPVEVVVQNSPLADTHSIWDDLLEFAGKAQGLPPDFADEHDHYIHGTPEAANSNDLFCGYFLSTGAV